MAKKKATKTTKPQTVQPLADSNPPTCPPGYVWNGSACVLDVG